ncbi:MAG: hypothetical protein C0603_03240 [Denitrovibrio sp.]|nr:MAG: hypothetical protein C0603_03240 [Denitrovibrio sp.]
MSNKETFEEFKARVMAKFEKDLPDLVDESIDEFENPIESPIFTDMESFVKEVKEYVHEMSRGIVDPKMKKCFRDYGKKDVLKFYDTEIYKRLENETRLKMDKINISFLKKHVETLMSSDFVFSSDYNHAEIVKLFWLVSDHKYAGELTSKERIMLKGACMEYLSDGQIQEVVKLLDYQLGIDDKSAKRMQSEHSTDEYFIYSRKQQKSYTSKQIESFSFWALLLNMLPEPILDALDGHKDSKKYLFVTKNKGSNYNTLMSEVKRDTHYMRMLLHHHVETVIGSKRATDYFLEEAEREGYTGTDKANRADFLAIQVSKVKNKYDIH